MKYFLIFLAISFQTLGQKNETEAVKKTVELFRLQLVDPDPKVLEKMLHKDLSYGHSSGVVERKTETIELLRTGSYDFSNVTFENQIYTFQKNTATVRCDFVATMLDKSKNLVNLNLKLVMVFVKEKNDWQLLLRQGFKLPATK
jgi:Domain of unknown function (DUF4440)